MWNPTEEPPSFTPSPLHKKATLCSLQAKGTKPIKSSGRRNALLMTVRSPAKPAALWQERGLVTGDQGWRIGRGAKTKIGLSEMCPPANRKNDFWRVHLLTHCKNEKINGGAYWRTENRRLGESLFNQWSLNTRRGQAPTLPKWCEHSCQAFGRLKEGWGRRTSGKRRAETQRHREPEKWGG